METDQVDVPISSFSCGKSLPVTGDILQQGLHGPLNFRASKKVVCVGYQLLPSLYL